MTPATAEPKASPPPPTVPPERRAVDDAVDARDVVWAHRFLRASRLRRGLAIAVVLSWAGREGWDALQAARDGCEARRTARLAALQQALSTKAPLPEGMVLPGPAVSMGTAVAQATQVLALDDGAALVVGGVIVGGGPVCRRP
jgi:hypothetical protein